MSVVLPVRNGADHVRDALADLSAQAFTDFEVVVVDDGSTDATPAVLATVTDPRVRVVAGPGAGIVAALRVGVAASRGGYIARMDADDRCAPERLAEQVASLDAHSDVVVVGCAFAVVDAHGAVERVEAVLPDDADLRRSLWVRNPFAHGSVMIRRRALDAAGGYRDDHPAAEDLDLWCRLAATGRLAALGEVRYSWQRSATATSVTMADDQRMSTARILDRRWADGLPPFLDRRTLADGYRRVHDRDPAGALAERFDELQLAVVVGLARHGHLRRAVGQLAAYLASRPGAWGATVVYAASGGRVTRPHRFLVGLRRRGRSGGPARSRR